MLALAQLYVIEMEHMMALSTHKPLGLSHGFHQTKPNTADGSNAQSLRQLLQFEHKCVN